MGASEVVWRGEGDNVDGLQAGDKSFDAFQNI